MKHIRAYFTQTTTEPRWVFHYFWFTRMDRRIRSRIRMGQMSAILCRLGWHRSNMRNALISRYGVHCHRCERRI